MAQYAKVRTDLISTATEVDGETFVVIKDPVTGNFFRVREPEHWLIQQLDGTRSPADVARAFREKYELEIGAEQVGEFTSLLKQLFFLEDNRSEQELARAARKEARKRSLLSKILYIRVKAFNPGRFLDWLARVYRPFHSRLWWGLILAFTLFGLGVMFANREAFLPSGPFWIFALGTLPLIALSILIITLVHEFAHAVICRHYGGGVKEIGFLLMYFQPCFYCNVSDAWLFPRRIQRLLVSLAGPFFQLALTALAVLVWRVTVPGTFISELARVLATISLLSYLFNFNPLLKLDGYYLLSDWLEIPNLRQKAFACLGNVFKRRILGWPLDKIELNRRQRRIFLTYSVLALLYSMALIGVVLFLLGRVLLNAFGGAGLLLLAIVVLYILRHSLGQLALGTITHIRHMKNLLKQPVRLVVYGALLIGLILVVTLVPIPYRVSGEIVVRPLSEYTLSLNEAGLIESSTRVGGVEPDHSVSILQMNAFDMGLLQLVPVVKDGQSVSKGDTLATLLSNQVVQEIEGARAELERLEGQLDLLRAPPKAEEVREAESRLSAARSGYTQSQTDFERAEELFNRELIASDELERRRSERDIAEAEWQRASSALDLLKSPPRPEEENVLEKEIKKQRARVQFLQTQTEAQVIQAPFDGVVSRQADSREILSVIDHHHIELLVPVSDFEIGRVEYSQPVSMKVRTYPSRTFYGLVLRIPEAAELVDGDMVFKVAAIVDNDDATLRDGMTGYAKIFVGDTSLLTYLYRKVLSKIRVEFWSWW
jgi:putative peptide zinc metalloprotease protein